MASRPSVPARLVMLWHPSRYTPEQIRCAFDIADALGRGRFVYVERPLRVPLDG